MDWNFKHSKEHAQQLADEQRKKGDEMVKIEQAKIAERMRQAKQGDSYERLLADLDEQIRLPQLSPYERLRLRALKLEIQTKSKPQAIVTLQAEHKEDEKNVITTTVKPRKR